MQIASDDAVGFVPESAYHKSGIIETHSPVAGNERTPHTRLPSDGRHGDPQKTEIHDHAVLGIAYDLRGYIEYLVFSCQRSAHKLISS